MPIQLLSLILVLIFTHIYMYTYVHIDTTSIEMKLYDKDYFTADDKIGYTKIPLLDALNNEQGEIMLPFYHSKACCNQCCNQHLTKQAILDATEGRIFFDIEYIPLARKDEDEQFTEEELRRRMELRNLDFMESKIDSSGVFDVRHTDREARQMGLMGVLSVSSIRCVGMSNARLQSGFVYNKSERERRLYVTVSMLYVDKNNSDNSIRDPEPPQRPKRTETAEKKSNADFKKDRFHFVLHDIGFNINDKGGKDVICWHHLSGNDKQKLIN